MKLNSLISYTENNSDEIIINALTKSDDNAIHEYVVNLTSDLLNGVFLSNEYKENAKNNINNFDDNEIGQLATYVTLTPYAQSALSKESNWEEKSTTLLEKLIGYIIGMIDKEEFLNNLLNMKELLHISNKFYNGLVTYFIENNDILKSDILKKLQ